MVHSVWNRMPMVINWTTPSPNTHRSTHNSQQSIQNTNEENSLILVIEQIEFISTQLDEECSSNFLNLLFFDTIKYCVSLAGCEVAEISIFFSTLYYFFVLLTHRHSPQSTIHTVSHQTHILRLSRFHLFAIQMIIQIQMQNKQQNVWDLGKECFIKFKNIILTQNILCVFKFEYFINGVHFLPFAAMPTFIE